ncbi:MAG TPA: hydroxysqualene dehydroxylase HpnE [Planctomycetaceae bacterium]|nr:hydroxysqualene dehydroxylase HpnE [Planctomycetaceae bacterium]
MVVVGGGLAGLAAAAALAPRGYRVTLLESRPRLGGRASSFVDQATGELIDNCQHVSLGCCTNFHHFCQAVGIDDALRPAPEMFFIGPDGRTNRLAASPLPVPMHLAPGFARLSYLTWGDKWRLAWGLRALARERPRDDDPRSFADWLAAHRQPPRVIERVWHVVLVSALSESLDRISVGHARKVFVDAFLASRQGWDMRVPAVPLDELYAGRVQNWMQSHGVQIRLQSGVTQVQVADGRAAGVVLRTGEELPAGHVVLAVPFHRVTDLLPESLAATAPFADAGKLQAAPISSVHLWFDREITPLPHAVLIERLSQWMFNRGETQAPGGERARYYQIVISASRNLAELSQAEVIEQVRSELAEIWPAARDARLLHGRMVTEHKAVFSVQPDTERWRPAQETPVPGLHLAGDWTRTGWPATMEGAVRSGYLAAESVLRQTGVAETLLQPDLPVARAARWLLGL